MEQDQLQTYEQGEGFKPGHTVDVIPSLDRINSRLNSADQEALAQVRRNNQTRVDNARNAGQDLIALSKMSKTLTDALVERQKGINEDEEAEGFIEGLSQHRAGLLDTSELDAGMAVARQQDEVAQETAAQVMGNSDENYEAAATIGKATTFREAGRRKGAAMAAVGQYETFMDQQLAGQNFTNSADYATARALATKQFVKAAGLGGVKPQFLAEKVYPAIMKADDAAMTKWSKAFAQEDSAMRVDEMSAALGADLDVAAFLSGVRTTVDGSGNPRGYKGAWSEFDRTMTEMRTAGMLSDGDIEQMKNQPIPGDPKGRTYGQLHEAKFLNIERKVSAQRVTDWKASQAQDNMVFEQEEQAVIDAFLDPNDTDGFTEAQLDEAEEALLKRFGKPSSRIQQLRANSTDAQGRKLQEQQIESLIKMNLLTPERLAKFDPKLQARYGQTANRIGKLRSENGNFKAANTAIEERIKGLVKMDKMSIGDPVVGMMISKMQREYQEEVTKLAIGGDPNAGQTALKIIDDKIQASVAQFNGNPKLITKFYKSQTLDKISSPTAYEAEKLNNVNRVLLEGGKDALSNIGIHTKEELENIVKNYGKPGWSAGAALNYAAELQGIDPITALNKQLELFDMDVLPPTPAMEVVNDLSPKQRQLLERYKTPERSSRGFATDGYRKEIVPKGYGDLIQQASDKHGIPASIIAGLIETESAWNPTAVSNAGARGLAQFMPATAAEWGVRPNDPQSAINGAGAYLKYLVDYFKGDMRKAIFAYNGGMGNIEKYGGPIPGSRENQEYYGKVMKGAYKYGYGKQSLQDPGLMRPSIAAQIPS